jgi:hypothetical protein
VDHRPDPDPRDLEAEGLPAVEDPPAGVEDVLEGIVAPRERPVAAGGRGVTAAEQRVEEPLADRALRETPDAEPGAEDPTARLVQPDQGVADLDVEPTEVAEEATGDSAALAAEEAAVHPTDSPS